MITNDSLTSGQNIQVNVLPIGSFNPSWIDEAMRLAKYYPGAHLATLAMGGEENICLYYPDADYPYYGSLCCYVEWRWSEIGERDVLAWWWGEGEFDCHPIRFGAVGVSDCELRSCDKA